MKQNIIIKLIAFLLLTITATGLAIRYFKTGELTLNF